MKTCGCLHFERGPDFVNYAYMKNDDWVCKGCSLPFGKDSPILKKCGAPVTSNEQENVTIKVKWKQLPDEEREFHKVPQGLYWVMRIGGTQVQIAESVYDDYLTNIFRNDSEGKIYDVIWYAVCQYPDPPKFWLELKC